jgi:hypothetical protein
MTTSPHKREVFIETSLENATAFLSEVTTLARWTQFFQRGYRSGKRRAVFETFLGRCETEIFVTEVPAGVELEIVSDFGARRERALVSVCPDAAGVKASFVMNIPDSCDEGRREKMLSALETELNELRRILEE